MQRTTLLRPTGSTAVVLAGLTVLASGACHWILLASVADCSTPHLWTCSFLGAAAVALVAGLGFAALLTSMAILTSRAMSLASGSTVGLEPARSAWPVSGMLLVLHFAAFGLLGLLGALPFGWEWWQGAFGVLGVRDPGLSVVR